MDKTLRNGLIMSEMDSPQPKMVGFHDFVGTDFAPVSNKTAVKGIRSGLCMALKMI